MTTLIDEVKDQIDGRMQELRPLVEEYTALDRMRDALGLDAAPAKRGPRRNGARKGRPPGQGKRETEVLKLLDANPKGLTIPQLGEKMGIKANYLYRLLPQMAKAGRVQQVARKRWMAVAPKA